MRYAIATAALALAFLAAPVRAGTLTVGKPEPDLEFALVDGTKVRLVDLRGRSWC